MLQGFAFAAVEAAVKKPGRLDLGLIWSEVPANAVGYFTSNAVAAAPVQVSRPRAGRGRLQAIVVNSGNANACTGPQGLADAARMADLVAQGLKLDPQMVAVCSTGVIGRPMPMDRIEAATPRLLAALGPDKVDDLAQAIITTDTKPKRVELTVDLAGHETTILGLAKGAGMIHPSLDLAPQATMLVFLLTDAAASPQALREAIHDALPRSFHGITVDGDTSTNDSLLCLANGRAGNPLIENYSSPGGGAFYAAVGKACRSLAEQIVADAEGVTKVVTIQVKGAGSDMEADMAAIAVALSPLCKTAFFGADPNWGRVICAVGYSGARVDPDKVDISFGGAMVCQGGVPTPAENLDLAQAAMKGQAFTVVVDLHLGEASKEFLTTDLSYDYVRINAEYTT